MKGADVRQPRRRRSPVGGRWRSISGFRDTTLVTNPASTLPRTPTYSYFDVKLGVKANSDFEIRGGVNSLTDKQPPVINGAPALTN